MVWLLSGSVKSKYSIFWWVIFRTLISDKNSMINDKAGRSFEQATISGDCAKMVRFASLEFRQVFYCLRFCDGF